MGLPCYAGKEQQRLRLDVVWPEPDVARQSHWCFNFTLQLVTSVMVRQLLLWCGAVQSGLRAYTLNQDYPPSKTSWYALPALTSTEPLASGVTPSSA